MRGAKKKAPFALRALTLSGLAAAAACSSPGVTTDDERAASLAGRVLELSRQDEPIAADLDSVFGKLEEADLASLRDALEALGGIGEARLVDASGVVFDDQQTFDYLAPMGDGGETTFSVHLRREVDGAWRVQSFFGGGVVWPAPGRRRGSGLSSSPPPGERPPTRRAG